MRGPCREDVLHEKDQLFPVNPKNFAQVSLIDRVLHFHFSTLEKTKMNHIPESNLILTFRRVSPRCRQEPVVQVHDVPYEVLPGFVEAEEDTIEGVLAVKFIIGRDFAVTRPSPESC